ncbi:putative DUR3-Urea permease [Fusarium fujikuroi]|nr:putative DUR3-Urea permease [Fusarium fujikuroi]
MNTIFIHCIVLAGVFVAYAKPGPVLGSPDKVWELLKEAATRAPVPGNAGGEYLTMRSNDAILLGIILWCAIFGCTIDVQLFQKSITADPAATLPGYIIGGVAWFSIPFCLATTFGLSARAMEFTELLPRAITPKEVPQGLVFPIAVGAMMGNAGLVLVLIMVFMACTSGFSVDTVSIASVYIYDIYKGYFNKDASVKQLVRMSHFAVAIWSLLMAVIATGISRTAISVNYIVTCIGIFCGCAVFPFYATLLWKKQSKHAVI